MNLLTVINCHSHAGDLFRLLITSQTQPTGGRFSGSYRDQFVPGDLFTGPCAHVCVCECVRRGIIPRISSLGLVFSDLKG